MLNHCSKTKHPLRSNCALYIYIYIFLRTYLNGMPYDEYVLFTSNFGISFPIEFRRPFVCILVAIFILEERDRCSIGSLDKNFHRLLYSDHAHPKFGNHVIAVHFFSS
jgi:hypothetical protein